MIKQGVARTVLCLGVQNLAMEVLIEFSRHSVTVSQTFEIEISFRHLFRGPLLDLFTTEAVLSSFVLCIAV